MPVANPNLLGSESRDDAKEVSNEQKLYQDLTSAPQAKLPNNKNECTFDNPCEIFQNLEKYTIKNIHELVNCKIKLEKIRVWMDYIDLHPVSAMSEIRKILKE